MNFVATKAKTLAVLSSMANDNKKQKRKGYGAANLEDDDCPQCEDEDNYYHRPPDRPEEDDYSNYGDALNNAFVGGLALAAITAQVGAYSGGPFGAAVLGGMGLVISGTVSCSFYYMGRQQEYAGDLEEYEEDIEEWCEESYHRDHPEFEHVCPE